jgi:O-antigen ligase
MNATVTRAGQAFRIGPRAAWMITIVLLFVVAVAVALATRRGVLPFALGGVLLGVITVASFRWPFIFLAAFALLIPIEEVLVIDGLGTITRFAGILFAVVYVVPRVGRLNFGALPTLGWAFLGWAIVSLGWAIDPGAGWDQLTTLIQLFVIAVLVADYVVNRPEIVRPLLWVYALSASLSATLGIAYFVGQGSGAARSVALEHQDPNHFAALLLPAVILGLYELVNGQRRILGAAVALVTTLAVVVSGSRGAWVAVAVAVVLFILPQLRVRGRIAAIVAALVLMVLAYQLPGVPDLLDERLGTALSTGGAGRTDIWSVAFTIYQSTPLLGVGWANFPVAYTSDAVRASDVMSWYHLEPRAPHNIVVGILVELGPIGLLLLALFLGPLLLRRGWGPDGAMIQAALASLLTMALFLDVLANRKQVWLVIGIAGGLAYLARQRRGARSGDSSGSEVAHIEELPGVGIQSMRPARPGDVPDA